MKHPQCFASSPVFHSRPCPVIIGGIRRGDDRRGVWRFVRLPRELAKHFLCAGSFSKASPMSQRCDTSLSPVKRQQKLLSSPRFSIFFLNKHNNSPTRPSSPEVFFFHRGLGSFLKRVLGLNVAPCRPMPFLAHFGQLRLTTNKQYEDTNKQARQTNNTNKQTNKQHTYTQTSDNSGYDISLSLSIYIYIHNICI